MKNQTLFVFTAMFRRHLMSQLSLYDSYVFCRSSLAIVKTLRFYALFRKCYIQVKIIVPNSTAGLVIGKAGATVKTIMDESGAKVS